VKLVPYTHQLHALAKIEHSRNTKMKAMALGDGMGLGKTLPTMMAAVRAAKLASVKLPSLFVVPSSCVPQWKYEFRKFFVEVRYAREADLQ
jgi:SNF2 family DNA or RNA helicase